MLTYEEARGKFARCRNAEKGYLLARNTRLIKVGNAFVVKLYDTNIVFIRPDGTYRIFSGIWRTKLTKDRINWIVPGGITQRIGLWSINGSSFHDGMLIDSSGKIVGETPSSTTLETFKKRVDKLTRKFIRSLILTCNGTDIGGWHDGCKVPEINNERFLTELWGYIVDTKKHTRSYMLAAAQKILRFALASRNYDKKDYMWLIMRNDLIGRRKNYLINAIVLAFMRSRKPIIAEMILNGELEDGRNMRYA